MTPKLDMKAKNKHLPKPPPTKPWMLDNTSSSRLRNMEIGLPPPTAVAEYEGKPLPPLPLRTSEVTTFSTEIHNAFRTPTTSRYDIPNMGSHARGASIAGVLNTPPEVTARQSMKVDRGFTFTESQKPDCHSLKTTGSVQKLLRITGADSTTSLAVSNTSQTPSGHNSQRKIKQVMGVEVPSDKGLASHGHHNQEISPLSHSSSSVYSEDSVEEVEYREGTTARFGTDDPSTLSLYTVSTQTVPQTVRPAPSFASAISAMPPSLHIVKTPYRGALGIPLATLDEPASPTRNNYSYTSGAFRQDLYHGTISELAQSSRSSSASSETIGNSHLGDSNEAHSLRQPKFFDRADRSRVRIDAPPVLRKLDTQSATDHNTPVRTPYPLPPSRFDFDDDDDDGPTPTQRDYNRNFIVQTAVWQESLARQMRGSMSLSPSSPRRTPDDDSTPTPRSAVTTARSPQLIPPPRLKHRLLLSRDSTSTGSRPPTVFSRTATTICTAPSSRSDTPPTSRPVSGNRTPTPVTQGDRIPIPAPSSTVPQHQLLHQHHQYHAAFRPTTPSRSRGRGPPPIPDRGPLAPPLTPHPCATRQLSSPTSSRSWLPASLAAWSSRTAERFGAARQAVGIRTPSESRRHKLKSSIRTSTGTGTVASGSTGSAPLLRTLPCVAAGEDGGIATGRRTGV